MNGREMAGKRRMVVHIGEHKTGTTSIQYFLHAENLAVARLGYYYPEVGLAEHQHAGWPAALLGGHKIMPRDDPGLTSDELLERLAADLPAGLTPVLSTEVYWELLDSRPKLFDEAMAVLSRDYDPTIVYFTRPALGQAWSAVVHAASAGVAQDPSEKLYHRMRGLETAHEKLARDYPTAVRVEYGNQDSVTAFVQTLGVLQREWTYHPRNVVRRIRLHRTVRFLEQNTPRRQNVAGYESAAVSLEFARGLTMLPPAPPHRWKQYQEFLHAVQADLVADPEAPAFPTSADLRQRAVDLGGERGSLLDERELAAVIEYLNRPKTEAFAEEQDCLEDLRAIVSRLASAQPTG